MIILGLTGSIGMGKSTAARMLRRMGIPVHDADASVHALMGPGGAAVPAVADAFPGVQSGDAIDRRALGRRVFGDDAALARLERILHPRVRAAEDGFLAAAGRRRCRLVVLDIPLLYETAGDRRVDGVVVVSAPRRIQELRVLARPGMTVERLDQIKARQVPDAEKRRRATWVIPTGLGHRPALRALYRVVRQCTDRDWQPPHRMVWRPGRSRSGRMMQDGPD